MHYYIKKCISLGLVGAMTLFSLSINDSIMAKSQSKLITKKLAMYVGEKATIKIKMKDKSCAYLFKTNKKVVAKVNKKGEVIAVKKGTAKITVSEKVKDTKKIRKLGVCKVVVSNKNIVIPTQTPVITPECTPEPESTPEPIPIETAVPVCDEFQAR